MRFPFSLRRNIPYILAFCLWGQLGVCTPSDAADVKDEIARILKKPDLNRIVTGIHVIDVDTGQVVFAENADRLFAPASNLKLVTTAAALDSLGPNYAFRTSVYRNGKIRRGVLQGDLIVRGSGDPNISGRLYGENITAIPDMWANTIREVGIEAVTGDIIADDTIFDREYIIPSWPKDQLWRWYCAPTCGLSFNDNCVEVEIRPGSAAGAPALLSSIPETSYIVFANTCTTSDNKNDDLLIIDRRPDEAVIKVSGKCWRGSVPRKYFVTVQNPALFLVTVFGESLKKAGVKVQGKPRMLTESLEEIETPENEIAACEHTLDETIAVTNKRSQNFYAEQLLKLIGYKMRGQGSFEAGISACASFLKRVGIPPGSYTMVDGCGLARENRMTPDQFTMLLRYMRRHRYNRNYVASLARPGEDSSLRNRFKDESYADRIWAKTGYINGVSALSGYLATKSGRTYAFSILMNDPKVRGFRVSNKRLAAIQDEICAALINS